MSRGSSLFPRQSEFFLGRSGFLEVQLKSQTDGGIRFSDDDEDLWTKSMRYKRPREFRYNYLNRYRYGKKPQPSRGETLLPGEWVEGRDAILPEPKKFEEIDYTPPQRIQEKFKEHGLQVIVKMASIELTPEKPHFPAGSWHVSPILPFSWMSMWNVC